MRAGVPIERRALAGKLDHDLDPGVTVDPRAAPATHALRTEWIGAAFLYGEVLGEARLALLALPLKRHAVVAG